MEIAASIVSATTRPDAGALGSCEQRKFAPASIWTAAMLAALEIGVTGRKWHSLIDKVYRLETLELGWVHTPIPSPSPRSTALSGVAYGRSCADSITVRGRAVACAITPTGQTRSSLILGCSRWSKLITWRANPDAETADWRARRGRTAHRVRREGTARAVPYPYHMSIACRARSARPPQRTAFFTRLVIELCPTSFFRFSTFRGSSLLPSRRAMY